MIITLLTLITFLLSGIGHDLADTIWEYAPYSRDNCLCLA